MRERLRWLWDVLRGRTLTNRQMLALTELQAMSDEEVDAILSGKMPSREVHKEMNRRIARRREALRRQLEEYRRRGEESRIQEIDPRKP